MKLNLKQQELKQIIGARFENVKGVQFDTGFRPFGTGKVITKEIPTLNGCMVTFNDEAGPVSLRESDIIDIVKDHINDQGFGVNSDSDIIFRMSSRTADSKHPLSSRMIPVFNGVAVECQELEREVPAATEDNSQKWGETVTFVSDLRKSEHEKRLMEMPDRDLCEMIRAHFESHPTLPGEKHLKNSVNDLLKDHPDGEIKLDDEVKASFVEDYADTRIRQTSILMNEVLPENIKLDMVNPADYAGKCPVQNIITDGRVAVKFGNVELQRTPSEEVYVLAERNDGTYQTIGALPDKFLKNNHMNIEFCKADLQLVDYSNGKMKNVSARVVVDTDLMSGDVIDLDDDMLAGLDQATDLQQ